MQLIEITAKPHLIEAGQTTLATPTSIQPQAAPATLWSWGWNSEGELGNGTTTASTTPVTVTLPSGTLALAASQRHSLAMTNDGTAYAWGQNNKGPLGDGTTTQRELDPVWWTRMSGQLPSPAWELPAV